MAEQRVGVDAGAELDRQLERLLESGYPAAAGRTEADLVELVEPLRDAVTSTGQGMGAREPSRSWLPFVVVVTSAVLPAARSMPLTSLRGTPGFVSKDTSDIERFRPIDSIELPHPEAYLLVDVERGDDLRDLAPNEALVRITGRGRTPLTVDEGISMLVTSPDVLEKNHCFSLVGSRCGDKRVPALWISGGAPKLGWCWAGNPHTWLGSASTAGRVGA